MTVTEKSQEIRRVVREKYDSVALETPEGMFRYETGAEGARNLGYDEETLRALPDRVVKYFCGVGHPFKLGNLERGNRVLDVGCGAGVDTIIAAGNIGPEGSATGIDLSDEMLRQARENLRSTTVNNVSLTRASGEILPFADRQFDVVISNGVFNLAPDKPALCREVFRVLKPGGRLQFADVILDQGTEPPSSEPKDWAG